MATKIIIKQAFDRYNKDTSFHELLKSDYKMALLCLHNAIGADYARFTKSKQEEIYRGVKKALGLSQDPVEEDHPVENFCKAERTFGTYIFESNKEPTWQDNEPGKLVRSKAVYFN
jgi:hypothetical protein